MQTKVLQKKTDRSVGEGVKQGENKSSAITSEPKNPAAKARDYREIMQMLLINPDAITYEDFIILQKAIGYREALALMEDMRQRKRMKKGALPENTPGTLTGGRYGQSRTEAKPGTYGELRRGAIPGKKQQNEQSVQSGQNDQKAIQMKQGESSAPANGQSETDMPDHLRAGLERLSGTDLSDVTVHRDSHKPQQVGALAYTQGSDIYVEPGQEQHLPHEGWHAVQQKQGRVKPTLQMKTGVSVNEDAGLEREADIMGSRALQEGVKSISPGNGPVSRSETQSTLGVGIQAGAGQSLGQSPGNTIQRRPNSQMNNSREDFDKTVRTGRMNLGVGKQSDSITFKDDEIKWYYIGTDVMKMLKSMQTTASAMRSREAAEVIESAHRPFLEKLQHNRKLKLSADKLQLLFLFDPEGVKDYLYGKSEALINDVYKRLTGKEPVYYAKTVTGWKVTDRRPGTWKDIFSEVISDARVLLTRNDGMPHDLISFVLPMVLTGLVFIGLYEIGLVAQGIAYFGLGNTLRMFASGTLARTLAQQSSMTNAAQMADEVVTLPKDTWLKGWLERGNIIDKLRGNGLGHNFPVIDKLENKVAVSIKSLDTAAATYQNSSALLSKLNSFVYQLSRFDGATYGGKSAFQGVDFSSKALELVIPDVQLSMEQIQAIIKAKEYANSLEIGFKIIIGQ
ncbi:hypothetical protein CLHUN_21990 [Ruminiclostridium hungatei]|uniref:Uncharacterized protein n=1 Tax=Ruminiclostridium hungatei TaxID=48256 RepID=A0A1V4SKD0_RUMHU|nr:DUF4157 domain-containing protein [Ruminiclostridium hungatei]OPX43956.1 hypothetical protein CLHUN_21990 [Ruminiclostridium hungatei]